MKNRVKGLGIKGDHHYNSFGEEIDPEDTPLKVLFY